MDWLIDRKNRSLKNFYTNSIIPLSFYGLGSVKDILELKMYEIEELKGCLENEELIKLKLILSGASTSID